MKPRALIFDLDGVLVDTEPVHMRAWQKVLAGLGLTLKSEVFLTRYFGLNDRDFLARFFAEEKRPLDEALRARLIGEKEKTSKIFLSEEIPLINGVEEFLAAAWAKKYPFALVTGSLASEVAFILNKLGWKKYFEVVVTAEDVKEGKPSPEGFLKAYEQLTRLCKWAPPLRKTECLVLEDSEYGIAAAKAAGMKHCVVKKTLKDARRFVCEDLLRCCYTPWV